MDVYANDYIRRDIAFMEATAAPEEIAKFNVSRWDVMITKDSEAPDDIGIAAVVVNEIEDLVCGYHLALIKPDLEQVDPVFLAKQISSSSVADYFRRMAAGSTRYGLSNGAIRQAQISLPPVKKQQEKIARILQTVDQAIETTKALIGKYQQVKAGLMHDLFTRGIDKDGKLRPPRSEAPDLYKETPIGWLPKEWRMVKLGVVAEIVSGVTLSPKEPEGRVVQVPYLRVANVQDGYLDLSEVKTVAVPKEMATKLRLKPGDVLMNEGGDFDKLGRGTVWEGQIDFCIHQNHVFRVRVNQELIGAYFLACWSQSEFGKRYFVLSSKQSTNLASINSTQLNAFLVAIPSLVEQREIEERLRAVKTVIDSQQHQLGKLKEQKTGLMHDLLTGKVEVKVDEPEAAHV